MACGRQEGRLAHLRYLVFHWPPHGAASLAALRALCPRLVCNGRAVPDAADPAIELDEAALDALAHLGDPAALAGRAPQGSSGAAGAADAPGSTMAPAPAAGALAENPSRPDAGAAPSSLAERFKAAYASRAAKLSAEHARNVRRAERRRAAALGGAERAVRMAELGVPLTRLRR